VLQGSASECVLVSMLAARHAALEELKVQYPGVEDGVLLARMVAYCSKLVRTTHYSRAALTGMTAHRHRLHTVHYFSSATNKIWDGK